MGRDCVGKTALDIAGAAGMAVPSSKLVRIGGDSALLLDASIDQVP